MDKNFINVDDLFRQRLGGGEEGERSGAWLQMRDLLDKEMPQSKGGFIYWRRMLGAVAVLLFVATAGIGGYMLTATKGGNANDNNLATNVPATTANNDQTNNANNQTSQTNNNTKQPTAADINDTKATVTVTQTVNASHTTVSHDGKTLNTNKTHNSKKEAIEKNKQFITQLIAANERNKQKQALAANHTTPASGGEPMVTASTVKAAAGTVATKNTSATTKNTAHVTTAVAAVSKPSHQTNTTNSRNAHVKNDAPVVNNARLAINSAITSAKQPKQGNDIRTAVKNTNEKVNVDKLALGSNTSAAKNIPGAAATSIVGSNNKVSATNNTPVASHTMAAASASNNAVNTNNKSVAGNNNNARPGTPSKNKMPGQVADNKAIKKEVAAVKMGKKVIDRLVLSEHFVKTAPNEGYFKLDTISIEAVNEELGLNKEPEHNPENGEKRTASANGVENNEVNQANGSTQLLPGATTSVTGKSGMATKENTAAKGSGTSALEKLSEAFNDIKFHTAGAQFAPGLTAGINGTFFGPNSFKGFQFGVTGNVSFGENLSILTELKYFHRINNNYSLSDNYYTYTPVAGGQYSKELQPVSYNFSTLHSIELPVSIRYCMSHFNFFAGGNLVYSFAINTGASTLSSGTNTSPVLVSAPGTDNAPKIKADDFNSNFGVGYLLGISYQVAPNMMIDFRNVQTVWNSASTPGGKIISNQLYKSPSLQVSIGYRLGGKKR